MEAFLQQVARDMNERCNGHFERVAVVFPNRRARLFFSRYLSQIIDKPVWMPQFLSVSELMQDISGARQAESMEMLFTLYTVYKQLNSNAEGFDEFYFWGEMMLADFDEVDKYMVDASDLFRNLAEWKSFRDQFEHIDEAQIEAIRQFWKSFNPNRFSDHQKQFVEIWEILGETYRLLQAKMETEGKGYDGFVARKAAQMIKNGQDILNQYDKIALVGFHVLNVCEETLFDSLQKDGRGLFYWDYDRYYLDNPLHEAGTFMRKNIKRYPSIISDDNFKLIGQKNRSFHLWPVPSNTGQARLVPHILNDLKTSCLINEKTALILSDEELLLPVLQSVPHWVETLNVTMGYPIKSTSAATFVLQLLDLQIAFERNAQRINHRLLLPLLEHPYLGMFEPVAKEKAQKIRLHNMLYPSVSDLGTDVLSQLIFQACDKSGGLLNYLAEILQYLAAKMLNTPDIAASQAFDIEFIHNILLSVNKLNDLSQTFTLHLKTVTLARMLRKMLAGLSVPFQGEPLLGLQVMGLLETRTLDFDNIVLMSVNEGVMPKNSVAPSFVPYNLRKGFGLTTIEHQDSIFAYYFYRILQRAENVHIMYDAHNSGPNTGEPSRFILQMLMESGWNVLQHNVSQQVDSIEIQPISFSNHEQTQKLLSKYVDSESSASLSPSALNNWLDCPLKFYLTQLAGIREADEMSTDIDSATFGNIFHKTFELLYTPFKGKTMTADDINRLAQDKVLINEMVDQAFLSEYFRFQPGKKNEKVQYHGRNLIVREVVLRCVAQMLGYDAQYAPFELVDLERKVIFNFPVEVNGQMKNIRIGGRIDRIDKKNNVLRVVDYKTSFKADISHKINFESVNQLFTKGNEERPSYVFQSFFYSAILSQTEHGEVKPALIFLGQLFGDKAVPEITQVVSRTEKYAVNEISSYKADWNAGLQLMLAELFDNETIFRQTDNAKMCAYCNFKPMCHR
jgi:hypothetical protein